MDPNYPVFANTLETYDAYFQDDRERYIRSYQEYEQYMALCEQEAGGSGSGTGSRSSPKKRAYIPRQRETAEERLIDDYFGDEEIDPKYTEENFRRRNGPKDVIYMFENTKNSEIVKYTTIFEMTVEHV
ncbi:hypothetical protein Tco_0714965 [Tanacetum coccineum]